VRVDALSGVPTLSETGLVKYEIDIFYGIVAPAKTPEVRLSQLTGWFSAALKAEDVQPKLARQGLFPVGMCGAPFGDYMRKHVAEYARIIQESGMAPK
jgi:tripartite-type tricarboxylate transporter receptor subunit TctC